MMRDVSRTRHVGLLDELGRLRRLLKEYPATFWLCEWARDSHVIAEAAVGADAKLLRIDVATGEVQTLSDISLLVPRRIGAYIILGA